MQNTTSQIFKIALKQLLLVYSICAFCLILYSPALAFDNGLVADYNFIEGSGTVLSDSSENNNDGVIHGAKWIKTKFGYCLQFDGLSSYVDCGEGKSLDLRGTVTIEAWIRPNLRPGGETGIVGKWYTSYQITFYENGTYNFYITSPNGNYVSRKPMQQDTWSHVVGTFDSKQMIIYVDGKESVKASSYSYINPGGKLYIGCLLGNSSASDPALQRSGYFNGMIGRVRIYNRALSPEEVRNRFKVEVNKYAENVSIDKLKISAFGYPDKKQITVVADHGSFMSVSPDSILEVQLIPTGKLQPVLTGTVPLTPNSDLAEITFHTGDLPTGRYTAQAFLKQKTGDSSHSTYEFQYMLPSIKKLPSPKNNIVTALKTKKVNVPYKLLVLKNGGFEISANGVSYPFESSFSYPKGGFNTLQVGVNSSSDCEKAWKIKTRKLSASTYEINARGKFYSIKRTLRSYPTHVYIKDTITNNTPNDLGILIDNHLNAVGKNFSDSYINGYRSMGRRWGDCSRTVFLGKKGFGIGIIPMDDVFVVQSEVFHEKGLAGISTNRFGLAPEASYTLEWAVYPNSTGDYYDFINAVRTVEKRFGKIEGGMDFINYSMSDRSIVLNKNWANNINLKYGSLSCLSSATDDPQVSIEGIEFIDFPKEIQVLKEKMSELNKNYPDVYGMFHIAHSLYCTDKPNEKFSDSRVINADGNQAIWPDTGFSYISKERQAAGWQWWIYYPTPGNSFHEAMMKSVDVMMDEIGVRGAFTDGLLNAYMGEYTYDRWDNHTVEIDPNTKTIKRKMGSVILLSQPSVVEYIRKINSKGGVVLANNCLITRTLCKEKVVINREALCADHHLSPTPLSLGLPSVYVPTETDIYRDVLNCLKLGSLYFHCGNGNKYTVESLPSKMFPITCETIYSGCVKGRDRIITMNSGIYGWNDSSDLHLTYKFDGRGVPATADFMTTVDSSGVRTQIRLAENESAVLKRIPIAIKSKNPVNVFVSQYDERGIILNLNGTSPIQIVVKNGDFPIKTNTKYSIFGIKQTSSQSDKNGKIVLNLTLTGDMQLELTPLK